MPITTTKEHILVYDPVLKRPGCVLLQAAMGATVRATKFPSESWLLAPTPNMAVYKISNEELQFLINMAVRDVRNGKFTR